ncbi:MAG: hypothetical protein Q8P45_00345 [Candidatus Harrisonbacteria bacterium]|nr:hypothetical protein [Candidatus Harrisonbacteria bacterium]
MKKIEFNEDKYFAKLTKRSSQSHVHYKHQELGLELSELLDDRKHKSLYIKLVKEHPRPGRLREIAKSVAERSNIKNPGAYFMRIVANDGKNSQQRK